MVTRTMPTRKPKKLWGTGQIAELIGTNPKTVATWIDEGVLPGVKLPGLNERRVHRDDLRAFCERLGYRWALKDLDAEEGLPPADRPPPAGGPPKAAPKPKAKGKPKK